MTQETMGDEWAAECEKIARRCQNARHSNASAYERDDALSDAAIALRHAARASRPAPSEASGDVVAWKYERNGVAVFFNERKPDYTSAAMGFVETPLYATPAPQADALRFITLWRKTGEQCLDWDFYVSENAHELQQVLANLDKQGVHQITTYRLGDKVEALADVLTESQTDAD